MNPQRLLHRRSFLNASAATFAAAATTRPFARVLGTNEALRVGLIGVGGRCRHLLASLVKIPDVRVVAACDVYEPHMHSADDQIEKNAVHNRDFRALLNRKDVDAVLIATSDNNHVPVTIAACEAGKDVYVEKPLTHKLSEGAAVIDAQNKHRRIVQVGMQQRSMPQFQRGLELVRAGRLGKIYKVHLTWNRNSGPGPVKRSPMGVDASKMDWKGFLGPAPDQPFDEWAFRNWRWFWDFGGGIFTDLMVHFIDVAHWYLDVDHPETALSAGTHNTALPDAWQTPDTVQTLLTYPGGVQVHFEGTFCNAREGAHIVFMGSEASLYLDRGRLEILPERGKGQPEELVLGSGRKGQDFYDVPDGELLHLTDWVEAVRSRRTPSTPAEAGVSAASAAHLANRALREGGQARWTTA